MLGSRSNTFVSVMRLDSTVLGFPACLGVSGSGSQDLREPKGPPPVPEDDRSTFIPTYWALIRGAIGLMERDGLVRFL